MNELTTFQERGIAARPNLLLDKETFQQIAEIASIMASASLIPESLTHEGSGDRKKLLPAETIRANCFLVANQAIKWGMDPFAVAQCSSVVHGRLMFEGKLVSAVLEANLGVKLVHAYGKWDASKDECLVGQDATGDMLAIRIGEGHYTDAGVAVFSGRYVDGSVGAWKTMGNNSPWRGGNTRKMLVYRGTREWARVYQPGAMLGVITDDEIDPAYSARDITPAPTAGAGQSVIQRLRANKDQSKDGFDADRVTQDLDTAAPQRSSEEAPTGDDASTAEVEESRISSTSDSTAPEAGQGEEGADVAVGESSAPSSPDEMQWLLNVAGMLWAATNYNGDADILKAQKVAAMASYDPTGISQPYRDKANSVFKHCMSVVAGEVEPADGLAIVAGIVGVEDKVLLKQSGRT